MSRSCSGSAPSGTTDDAGTVRLSLKGNEGDVAVLSVKCPDTFASPEASLSVGLRPFRGGLSASPASRYGASRSCVHSSVGIRTENGRAPADPSAGQKRLERRTISALRTSSCRPRRTIRWALTLDTTDFPPAAPSEADALVRRARPRRARLARAEVHRAKGPSCTSSGR